MQSILTRRTAARLFFIIGFLLAALGFIFFQGSITNISGTYMLISLPLVLIGVGCAVAAVKLNKSSLYFFFAAFAIQVGVLILLIGMEILPVDYSRLWPFLSVFSGIALIPTGLHRYGVVRFRYLVPSLAFIFLGAVMLIFSLKLVPFSLSQFIKDWWPFLIVLCGLILMFVSLGTKKTGEIQS